MADTFTGGDPVKNPYGETSVDFEPHTLPMDEIIRRAIKAQLLLVRVSMPCQVVKVINPGTVDVQPGFMVVKQDNSMSNLPVIHNVPIAMIQGVDYSIKLPVAVNDTGRLIFMDRNIDAWLAGDGTIAQPVDFRAHDIADAVFSPDMVPFQSQVTDQTTDLIITNGKSIARIQKGGTFQFKNDQYEFLDLVVQLATQTKDLATQTSMTNETLSEDTVNTVFGPMQLNMFSEYATIKSNIDIIISTLGTIIDQLNTLKGSS